MKTKEFLQTTPVFTTADVQSHSSSNETAETVLRRAVASGEIERIRRGLYASKTGKYHGEATEPFRVVSALDPQAVVSYHAALVAHGLAHNVSFTCAFRSDAVRTPFAYESTRYVPYPADPSVKSQVLHAAAYGSVLVTTREQTLVDCLAHPSRAGGAEEAVRSLSAMAYVNFDELDALLSDVSDSAIARIGWLLEQKQDDWHVADGYLQGLEQRLGRGPYRLSIERSRSEGWARRWKLCLPEDNEEVSSWVWS